MFSPMKRFGIEKPFGKTSFRQRNFFRRSPTASPMSIQLLALVEVDVAEAVRLDDVDLLVLALAEVRVDDDGAVVARVDEVLLVAVLLHGADDAVELPRAPSTNPGRRSARRC